MAENFYTIITTVGQAKIANAQVTGQKVNLTEIAAGDGGGAYYNPDQTQTALKNEIWRGNISAVQVDEQNPNWIVIEGVILSTEGGFFVREVGVFDENGDLIAIGKYPETYKPATTEGSAKDLYIRMIIEVSNASAVTLRVDPSVIIASRKYVDDKIAPVEQKANQTASTLDAHLNETVTDGVHGLATTQPVALYVDANNGDDTNDGKTPQTAYKTIQKAVSSLPKFIEHLVTINVAPGDYSNEDVLISGFVGKGTIQLLGDASISNTRVVGRIFPANSTINIYVRGFRCLGISKAGVQASYCESVTFEYLNIDNQDSESGIFANVSRIFVRNSVISNRGIAINAGNLSQVLSVNNTGTNNSTALRAHASIIRKEGTQPSGTTNELTLSGGLILGGSAAAIVDMGANANGTYVRWSNGLQICWHRFGDLFNPGEIKAWDWIYPAAFSELFPFKTCGGGPASDNIDMVAYGFNHATALNTKLQTRVVMKSLHTGQATLSIEVMAIGRWK